MGDTAVGQNVPAAAVGLREGLAEGPDVRNGPAVGPNEGVALGCWLAVAGLGGEDGRNVEGGDEGWVEGASVTDCCCEGSEEGVEVGPADGKREGERVLGS